VKIGVLVKQVPDTESRIVPNGDGSGIDESGLKFVPNPYDEFAIELGLQLSEAGAQEVVVIGLGPERAMDALRTALAMGADRAVHLVDDAYQDGDAQSTARALAAVVEKEGFDLVLAGRQAVDDDDMQVPQLVAEALGWPSVSNVHAFEMGDGGFEARRSTDGGEVEVWKVSLPAVASADKGLNEPRYASLPGIMKAKRKPVDSPAPADLGLDPERIGAAGRAVQLSGYRSPPARPPGRIIEGADLGAKVKELVSALRSEAKVV
jgi:electron transfer flavoprotein beta subunit